MERRLEQVAGADGDATSQAAVERSASGVLMNGIAGVDPLAFQEIAADGGSGAFRRHEDDVDILGWDHSRLIGIYDAEAVRKVEGLAGSQLRFEFGPIFLLAGIREQILDNRPAAGGFFQR